MKLYSFYFFKEPRSCIASVGAIEAENIYAARDQARAAIRESYPEARLSHIVDARKSRFPVKTLDGELVAPSQIQVVPS